jgi:cell division protein FtsB
MKNIVNSVWEYIRENPKKVFFQVGFVLFVIWMLFDDLGIVKRIRMQTENRVLHERLKQQQQKILENEERIQNAKKPDSIEKAAREKYNFRKQGETLFIIRDQ